MVYALFREGTFKILSIFANPACLSGLLTMRYGPSDPRYILAEDF